MPPQRTHDGPATRPESAEEARRRIWSEWFATEVERRALRNRDMARLLDAVAERIGSSNSPSSMIAHWKRGASGASETAAMYVALALGLPIPFVLRKAGHEDAARMWEQEPRAATPSDEARERARTLKDGIDELVQLAEIGKLVRAEREESASRDAS